jgi:hypothetical protein
MVPLKSLKKFEAECHGSALSLLSGRSMHRKATLGSGDVPNDAIDVG